MCSTLTLNLFLSGTPLVTNSTFGELDQPGLIDFGRFYQTHGENLWSVEYIFIFAAMGAVGGLMGAWFNSLNKQLTVYRMKHVFTKHVTFKLVKIDEYCNEIFYSLNFRVCCKCLHNTAVFIINSYLAGNQMKVLETFID